MIDFGNGSGGFGSVGMASLVVAVIAVVYTQELVETVNSQKITFGEQIDTFAKGNVEEHLTDVAKKHGEGYCDTAAKEMERYLKKKGEDYKVLTLVDIYGSGLIYSVSRGINVATNGYHMGVLYKGKVYCTIHPYGMPFSLWEEDFEGEGGPLQLVGWP